VVTGTWEVGLIPGMEGAEQDLDRGALVALVVELRRELAVLREENEGLRRQNGLLLKRVEELEKKTGSRPTKRVDAAYSVKAQERRRAEWEQGPQPPGAGSTRERQGFQRRGRVATEVKVEQAEVREVVLPEGCVQSQCEHWKTRVVWRIREGRAVRVAYDLWRGPQGEEPVIHGVRLLSEFGSEIHIGVSFLTYIVGLSLDKVCALLKFFWKLDLSKSQANALLNQLSCEWEVEFETLCTLLAHSAVVHADETRWSIHSAWALLSEQSRLLIFGCHKDADTLELLLPKATFTGIMCSDDAAIYRDFSTAQKCWAHLLRKAIKFTLLDPANAIYQRVLDELLAIYYEAQAHSLNEFLSDSERTQCVEQLTRRLCTLCGEFVADESAHPAGTTAREFYNLMSELTRLSMANELFTFVIHPAATVVVHLWLKSITCLHSRASQSQKYFFASLLGYHPSLPL
jgi:hypothetical protein